MYLIIWTQETFSTIPPSIPQSHHHYSHHTLKGDQDFGLCQTVISTNFPTDWQDSHNADKHQRRPSRYLSILVKISLHSWAAGHWFTIQVYYSKLRVMKLENRFCEFLQQQSEITWKVWLRYQLPWKFTMLQFSKNFLRISMIPKIHTSKNKVHMCIIVF